MPREIIAGLSIFCLGGAGLVLICALSAFILSGQISRDEEAREASHKPDCRKLAPVENGPT